MRELRFKAWHKDDDGWYSYDFELNDLADGYILGTGIEIKDCEVVQYTGLKDKNGKEIYEGDIIEYIGGKIDYGYGVVETFGDSQNLGAMWIRSNPITNFTLMFYLGCNEELEVIGNIYENKNLLLDND